MFDAGMLIHCGHDSCRSEDETKISRRRGAARDGRDATLAGWRFSRQRIATSRLSTPSSPVTGGVLFSRTALHEGLQFRAQRLGMTDRKMAHRIAAVRLEAEAFGDLAGQQIADQIFAARRDMHGARLERRQPVGVDMRKHAGGGAELQQRDVLALGHRARQLRLHFDDLGIGEPADQIDVVHREIDHHADIRHARRKRSDPGDARSRECPRPRSRP